VLAVFGLGGGSCIGMAKVLASMLEEKSTGLPARAAYPTEQPLIAVVAIPTTYAGSEMTPVYGITHLSQTPPRKITVSDAKIAPKLVLYDPELTLGLSPEMTASTGMNALAHCMEALYSITRSPLSTAAAIAGIQSIYTALPRCYADGRDLCARTEMLTGAHLAGVSLSSVSMGLHHGLCHVLGGSAAVPHGIANSIILPHVLRFNAQTTALQLLPAVEAMGIPVRDLNPPDAVELAVRRIFELTRQMNLPQRLRDVGVQAADLPDLARLGFQNRSVQSNPRPVQSASEIEELLRAAW
jgi:maleylacetate reductase